MRRSYKKFYDSLDDVAPKQKSVRSFVRQKRRLFFNQAFHSKKAIVDYVKSFPQLEDAIDDYKKVFTDHRAAHPYKIKEGKFVVLTDDEKIKAEQERELLTQENWSPHEELVRPLVDFWNSANKYKIL